MCLCLYSGVATKTCPIVDATSLRCMSLNQGLKFDKVWKQYNGSVTPPVFNQIYKLISPVLIKSIAGLEQLHQVQNNNSE